MFEFLQFDKNINTKFFIQDKIKFLKKNLDKKNKIKISFCGGYTLNDCYDFLTYFLKKNNINPNINNNIWGAAFTQLNYKIKLDKKEKNFLIIFNSWRDLISSNSFTKPIISKENLLNYYKKYLDTFKNKDVNFIFTDFQLPNFTISDGKNFNLNNYLQDINLELENLLLNYDNVTFLKIFKKINKLAFIKNDFQDWYSYGKLVNLDSMIYCSYLISKEISKHFYSQKKVLVTDLDNTLWGGVVGDSTESNLLIGNENPEARIFLDIQLYLKMLKDNGIILCISSKNTEKIALNFLNNKRNIIKLNDFASFRINWEKKYKNIISMSKELNLGLESFVFFDDNPSERLEIKKFLPMVSVPEIGSEPENFLRILENYEFFDLEKKTTIEDTERTKKYLESKKRNELKKNFKDEKNFMRSLRLKIIFHSLNKNNLERVYQLTNKTNQFNFSTIRLNKSQIKKYINKNKKIFIISASDKFGDYGIISIMYATITKDSFIIDNWVMSCRVFGKSIEQAIINFLLEKKIRNKKIIIKYIATDKNTILIDTMNKLNFKNLSSSLKYSLFEYDKKKEKLKHFCKVISYEE